MKNDEFDAVAEVYAFILKSTPRIVRIDSKKGWRI